MLSSGMRSLLTGLKEGLKEEGTLEGGTLLLLEGTGRLALVAPVQGPGRLNVAGREKGPP